MCALIHRYATWHLQGLASRWRLQCGIRADGASSTHGANGLAGDVASPVSPPSLVRRDLRFAETGNRFPAPFRSGWGHPRPACFRRWRWPVGRTRSRGFAAPAGAPLRTPSGADRPLIRRVPTCAVAPASLQPLAFEMMFGRSNPDATCHRA